MSFYFVEVVLYGATITEYIEFLVRIKSELVTCTSGEYLPTAALGHRWGYPHFWDSVTLSGLLGID
jgi:hypothetical protein